MTRPARPSLPASFRRFGRVLAGVAIAALSAGLLAWLFRVQVAGLVLERWCGARDLTCTARIETLGLGSIHATGLEVRTQSGTPLAVDAATVELGWPGLLKPQVTKVALDRPRVHARFDGQRFDLHGLEALVPQRRGGDRAGMPRFSADDGVLSVATPAGRVMAGFSLDAQSVAEARGRVSLRPAKLASGGHLLDWSRAALDITVHEGRAVGSAVFRIDRALFDGLMIDAADMSASIGPEPDGSGLAISMQGTVGSLERGATRLHDAAFKGRARLARPSPEYGLSELERLVQDVAIDLTSGRVAHNGTGAQTAQLQAELSRARDETLAGPFALTLTEVDTPALSARQIGASGTFTRPGAGGLAFSGPLVLEGATVSRDLDARLGRLVRLPAPLAAHGGEMAKAVSRAGRSFDLGLALDARHTKGADWQLSARRGTALTADSGLSLGIEPFGRRPWFEMDGEAVNLSGRITLSGGGAPSLSGLLDEARIARDEHLVRFRAVTLSPWREAGLELALELDSARLAGTRGEQRIDLDGEARLDGRLQGLNVSNGRIYGALEAVRGTAGWRMQTRQEGCLGVGADGLIRGDIALGPVTLAACPADGRLLQQDGAQIRGQFTLERLDLPMRLSATAARLDARDVMVDWSHGDGLQAEIAAPGLALRLLREDRPLDAHATATRARISTEGQFPSVDLRLEDIRLDDPALPAKVTLEDMSLFVRARPGGPDGEIMATGVEIRDTHKDAFYQPLRLDLAGTLRGERLRVTGPVRLARKGVTIGDLETDLVLGDTEVSGRFTSRPLTFTPGGLQPHHVSERLRGYFTGATGTVTARADLDLSAGRLTTRGQLGIADFSFQTLAFGRVHGVDGEIAFNDLLDLTTPVGQTVRIARIDAGFPLENGVIRFHLEGGREARLEAARWPFAGGSISVAPVAWRLADPERTLTVNAHEVDLARLTELAEVAGLEASGTVSGHFPIVFRRSSALIRDARLVADAPGGHLKYNGAIAERARGANAFADYAFRALEDLDFSILELAADGDLNGTVVATISLRGRNPDVLDGAEFDFDISIDSPLMRLFASRDRMMGTDWISRLQAEPALPEGSP